MRSKLQTMLYAMLLATLSMAAGGCEDAAKHGVQAHVPALAPAKAAAAQFPPMWGSSRCENFRRSGWPRWHCGFLRPKTISSPQVEAKFASGEQNYKAGHLEAARRDFDDAVDWMLESGYDPNSDPKLSELFHRVSIPYTDTSCRPSAKGTVFRRRRRCQRPSMKWRR